ncbi:MAG: DUF4340 domain-containing protein [Cyanobacteria bacterium REEB494]|nr:DUF4340 domain-containing protein [Cyanobacteria bacterium REEB494]
MVVQKIIDNCLFFLPFWSKMKRTTLVLVILALALGGFVYFDEMKRKSQLEQVAQNTQKQINQPNNSQESNQREKKQIFSFNTGDIQSITIKTQDYTLDLEQRSKSEPPNWLVKLPPSTTPKPAQKAIVSYLTDLLTKGKTENIIPVPVSRLSEFGLDKPFAVIDIKLQSQEKHQLVLGKPNFNNTLLYAKVNCTDSNSQSIEVLLVSKDFANAVNRQLSEWEEPTLSSSDNLPN